MKKFHKLLVGLFVAFAVALPLGVLALNVAPALNAAPAAHPVAIVRVATDNTPTPTPPGGGGGGGIPCPGGHC